MTTQQCKILSDLEEELFGTEPKNEDFYRIKQLSEIAKNHIPPHLLPYQSEDSSEFILLSFFCVFLAKCLDSYNENNPISIYKAFFWCTPPVFLTIKLACPYDFDAIKPILFACSSEELEDKWNVADIDYNAYFKGEYIRGHTHSKEEYCKTLCGEIHSHYNSAEGSLVDL